MHSPDYTYAVAELVDVIDGDTLDLKLSLGFHVTKQIRVRLYGIDTAEIYGTKEESQEHKLGDEQTAFVRKWLEAQDYLVARTIEDETGKYGRYLAYIYGDTRMLSNALRDEFPSLRE